MEIKLGTRGSELAMTQTLMVAEALRTANPEISVEVITITTTGDRSALRNAPMDEGKGDFVKEIEAALIDGKIDAAVHSLKDLPVNLPEGLILGACLPRANPRDMLVSEAGWTPEQLPEGARVGASSPRRKAMMKAFRADLEIVPIRGNVPTRLRKLEDENEPYDAVILAAAGLERLGLVDGRMVEFDEALMLPAPCQGIIGVEIRVGENEDLWFALNDEDAWAAALCERAATRGLGADCHTPLGVHAQVDGNSLTATARLLSPDGLEEETHTLTDDLSDPEELGYGLAEAFNHVA